MVDTHCHLDDARYNGNEKNIIAAFNDNRIDFVINNASNLASVYSTLKLTEYINVYGAIGCHPEFVSDFDKITKSYFRWSIK
jgi:Mg-dependent DNase